MNTDRDREKEREREGGSEEAEKKYISKLRNVQGKF